LLLVDTVIVKVTNAGKGSLSVRQRILRLDDD